MKSSYILASALSLAVVGASIISPFSYSFELDEYTEQAFNKIQSFYTDTVTKFADFFNTEGSLCIVNFEYRNYDFKSSTTVFLNASRSGSNYVEGVALVRKTNNNDSLYSNVRIYFDSNSGVYAPSLTPGGFQWAQIRSTPPDPYYYWYCSFCSIPEFTYNGSEYVELGTGLKNTSGIINQKKEGLATNFQGTLGSNFEQIINHIYPPPTEPPNTTPAPGFPNLPNEWVNGNGNTYNIDLPDFDFNIDLPSYTMPEAVSIPADIVQKSSVLYQIPLNVIDRYGLWWLVGLALICTVITLILNR